MPLQWKWRVTQRPITVLVLALGLPVCASVNAAPLDKAACDTLSSEREQLVAEGVQADIDKGAATAKSLPPERLQQVKRMIELTEQLAFRCGKPLIARSDGRPLLNIPEPAEPANKGGTAKGEGKKGEGRKRAPASDDADKAVLGTEEGKSARKPQLKKRKPPAKKASDANDAYVPPSSP